MPSQETSALMSGLGGCSFLIRVVPPINLNELTEIIGKQLAWRARRDLASLKQQ